MKPFLSVIILTKNEEKNIVDCIESVLFSDEILVIDDESTDRTVEIVRSLNKPKIRVLVRRMDHDFSAQRNFALKQARGEWILFIDADERVSNTLAAEISNACLPAGKVISPISNEYKGFYIKRLDSIWGKILKHGEMGNMKLIRLAQKNAGEWEGNVHETWKIKGKTGELENPILHYPHQSITEFLKELNYYTDLRARELLVVTKNISIFEIVFYPTVKFIVSYILKLGFLDGVEGFIVAMMMSFHSFLVRGKVYLLQNRYTQS